MAKTSQLWGQWGASSKKPMSIFKELVAYFRIRKKYWLLPLVLLLALLGILIVFSQGSPLAPFIYTLF